MTAAASLKDQILGAQDIPTKAIPVPEWGKPDQPLTVYLAYMNGLERDEFERWLSDAPDTGRRMLDIVTMVLSLTLRDEQGARLFSAEEAKALGKKNMTVLTRIYEEAIALNKIGLTSAETVEGKSGGVPGSSSSSALPSI